MTTRPTTLPSKGVDAIKQNGNSPKAGYFKRKLASIRVKLTALTLAMIALITMGSSMVTIQNMDRELLNSLTKRGVSIALSAAIPAGYSILTGDRLALDNLVAKIQASQKDISYLAVLDLDGNTLAHSKLSETGTLFEKATVAPLAQSPDFTMHMVDKDGLNHYEFQTPIHFSGNQVGNIIVGIDSSSFIMSKESARQRILLISLAVLIFGSLCTFMLSSLITAPIERLSTGVSEITAGNYQVEVKVTSNDELGELTRSFNDMSQVILQQKENLGSFAKELEDAYISTIKILAAALDARDNYTFGHSARVARLSLLIGKNLGLSDEKLKELEIACFLHDIGKIHVPDMIINKPTPLDQEEAQVIKKHPEQGGELLQLAESLHKYIPVVRHHHEWYNGNGYPHGLQGDEIHIYAQIVAIADAYDAMTSSRPYRKGCSRDEAVTEITKFRGIQFNPQLTDIFLDSLSEYEDDQALFSSGAIYESHHFLYTHNPSDAINTHGLRNFALREKTRNKERRHSNVH